MPLSLYRFGPFELDASAYQLRREGAQVKLEQRPMDLLLFLVERSGALVSRNEIVERLWGPDVFVDVEAGIHTAMRKIRQALGDSSKQPQYVVTVPGKGYRFAAAVTTQRDTVDASCVAVLPMQSLDLNPDSQYLADGITEEIIAALGHALPKQLRVIGRTTMMRYKGSSQTLASVSRETRAAYLVESSLRCESEAIRVVARLIEAQGQTQLWTGTFDGERRQSVLALQRQLSDAIADQVKCQLTSVPAETFARRQPSSAAAYDLYLRGRYLWHQLSAESTRRAIEHFQRANTLDENYALAWAGLAVCFSAAPITGDASSLQVLAPARNAAAKASQSEPQLAETHTAAGFVRFWLEWDFVEAEKEFRRAIELDPSDAIAHRTLAVVLSHQHRREQARSLANIA